jgi:hypothetical protein
MLALGFVLMQFMISAKAGLVNYVDGQTSVRLHEQVPVGAPIQTGPNSHIELLLNPGSFLRLDENSTVLLDSVELTNIAVRVVSGGALVEAAEIDKRTPIRITSGGLTVLIVSSGMYRFFGDTAVVLDGKLQTSDSSITVKKGREITGNGGQYEVTNVPASAALDELQLWSRQRSSALAKANALAYNGHSTGSVYYPYGFSNSAAWMYSPFLSGFTFIPRHNYRSYYGYSFVPFFVFGGGGFKRPPSRIYIPKSPAVTSRPPQSPPASVGGRGARPSPSPSMGAPSHGGTFGQGSIGGSHAGGGSHVGGRGGGGGGHGGHR